MRLAENVVLELQASDHKVTGSNPTYYHWFYDL